jgi:glycosyltransferase involved in cell wall biosynthesis
MPSIHVIRWIQNLESTSHELYWYDILEKGELNTTIDLIKITNRKKRKLPYFKGEYFLYKNYPRFYQLIRPVLEKTEDEILTEIINEIQPNVVHSFEMQSCSYPILKTMQKFSNLKWLYSCWGNDLYYYKNFKVHRNTIIKVLKRVNYIHTDCQRDFEMAKSLGFNGDFLGVIPGGTGYKLDELQKFKMPVGQRKIILVKGYEHIFGRGLNIIKALEEIIDEIKDYQVVVFAAHSIVIEYIKLKKLPFNTIDRHGLKHDEVLELMGKALVYIGNSISDGMSNTLLEAIVMGAFPIQSNPGGVTSEIIENGKNGLLIENPDSVLEIIITIQSLLQNDTLILNSFINNQNISKTKLDYEHIQQKIITLYDQIGKNI